MGKTGAGKSLTSKDSARLNCWEYTKCGRQTGGRNTGKLGVCPASTCRDLDGAHGGRNAGRACWVVAGSLCGGKAQGTLAKKLMNCWKCDFMNAVKCEEEPTASGFTFTRLGMMKTLEKIKNDKLRPKTASGKQGLTAG